MNNESCKNGEDAVGGKVDCDFWAETRVADDTAFFDGKNVDVDFAWMTPTFEFFCV